MNEPGGVVGDAEGSSGGLAGEGRRIIVASWVGTAVYVVAALVGTIDLDRVDVTVVVSLALFAVGTVAFIYAYLRGLGRSRYEQIGMGSLFLLSGSAPRDVRFQLTSPFVVQIVVALVTSSVRMYTGVAFGILVPMFGIGLMALWSALHGTFPPRR